MAKGNSEEGGEEMEDVCSLRIYTTLCLALVWTPHKRMFCETLHLFSKRRLVVAQSAVISAIKNVFVEKVIFVYDRVLLHIDRPRALQ